MARRTEPVEDDGEIIVDHERIGDTFLELLAGVESLGKYADTRIVGAMAIKHPEILAEMIEFVRRSR